MIQVASAIALMTIFLTYMVLKYGWLSSISDSYYELSKKWLFQVTMIAFAVLLVGVYEQIHSPFIPMVYWSEVLALYLIGIILLYCVWI